jgi:hypothetical protein
MAPLETSAAVHLVPSRHPEAEGQAKAASPPTEAAPGPTATTNCWSAHVRRRWAAVRRSYDEIDASTTRLHAASASMVRVLDKLGDARQKEDYLKQHGLVGTLDAEGPAEAASPPTCGPGLLRAPTEMRSATKRTLPTATAPPLSSPRPFGGAPPPPPPPPNRPPLRIHLVPPGRRDDYMVRSGAGTGPCPPQGSTDPPRPRELTASRSRQVSEVRQTRSPAREPEAESSCLRTGREQPAARRGDGHSTPHAEERGGKGRIGVGRGKG